MNEEVLSALLDGECSPTELDDILRRLEREPALRAQLARLSLARDVRRGLHINPVHGDLASRVRAALPVAPDARASVTRLPATRAMRWRPVAALAAAAAFGAVAVLVLKPQASDVPGATTEVAAAPAAEQPAALDAQDVRDLRRYQMSYSEARAHAVSGGTLGYARYAAYVDDPAVADGR